MGNHVFISYSRKDQTYARSLADDLRRHGCEVWIDDRIDYGDRWWRTIVQAIRSSAALIVVMTPDAEESDWVEKETMLAQREGKPILPLLLRGKEFPLLITTQYADVTGGQMPPQDFYDRLRRVFHDLGVPESPPLKPERASVAPVRQPFELEMILIPAGEFLMGSDPSVDEYARDREQPQHTLYLPDYYLAKTLVTNAQYAAFVQATGHTQPGHWKGGKPPGGKEDHPVVNVSWHDAIAYCRWLSETTDRPYHLPSEAEWEKGARGSDGRIWPWGNRWDVERSNTLEDAKGDTTPVGAYPQGASPYGLLDMVGNVWEWTRSVYKDYPYVLEDGQEDLESAGVHVLRGGSWSNDQFLARCVSRGRDLSSDAVGFRLVSPLGSEFWRYPMDQIRALEGKPLLTLDRRRPFEIVVVAENWVKLRVVGTGKMRTVRRKEIKGAFHELALRGEISRSEIHERHSPRNPAYIAAILAEFDGVTYQLGPIRLFYRSE